MSRFRIGVGLLTVLLAVCLWSQLRMARIQKPIAASVAQAEEFAARGDWFSATQTIQSARESWEKRRTFLSALADHQPLEDIECLFAMLQAYGEEQDEAEFRSACLDLNRRILAVKEAQEFSIGSIL